jgi:N6-L-threonylcarbamoyladenine synthase
VLFHVRGVPTRRDPHAAPKPAPDRAAIADIAAGFQAACVDVIFEKLRRAARRFNAAAVVVGGGVSANRGLRAALARFHLPVFFPDFAYCTDNAAMIAGLAELSFQQGRFAPLDLDAIPYSQLRRVKMGT